MSTERKDAENERRRHLEEKAYLRRICEKYLVPLRDELRDPFEMRAIDKLIELANGP
jgi:hypothetical protein